MHFKWGSQVNRHSIKFHCDAITDNKYLFTISETMKESRIFWGEYQRPWDLKTQSSETTNPGNIF